MLLALGAAAAVRPALAAQVKDARGRAVAVASLSRLVCIGGAITEIVYALGLQDHVVAVDSTSEFPPDALRTKRNIGYMRSLSPEGVLSVSPSLLLVIEGAGPPEALDVLTASSVPLLFVDGTASRERVTGRVRFLAGVLGAPAQGDALCASIDAGFARLDQWRAAHAGGQRVLFVLSARAGRLTVAGTGTAADAIIGLAGGVNAAASLHGYRPLDDEAVTALAPDIVLTMDHAGPPPDPSALGGPGLRATPAGRHNNFIHMDGPLLLGFGPRAPAAALELAQRLADAVKA
ncbi:MAG: ABC transporter substrate-binding protein [Rhodospirillales bacterium]